MAQKDTAELYPIHPGEILIDELEEIGMNASELSLHLRVPANRIYQIVNKQRNITADTAIRLGVFFDMDPEFWLNLQKEYELDLIRTQLDETDINEIIPYKTLKKEQPNQ